MEEFPVEDYGDAFVTPRENADDADNGVDAKKDTQLVAKEKNKPTTTTSLGNGICQKHGKTDQQTAHENATAGFRLNIARENCPVNLAASVADLNNIAQIGLRNADPKLHSKTELEQLFHEKYVKVLEFPAIRGKGRGISTRFRQFFDVTETIHEGMSVSGSISLCTVQFSPMQLHCFPCSS